jgi:ABC-type branched-subunit amino acid transport system substrate-binding protein
MKHPTASLLAGLALGVGLALSIAPAMAQKKYDPGASDTEIHFGQSIPYSGPLSSYGTLGKTQLAYFKMINDAGGVNGRKLMLTSLDDGYSPPRTMDATRKLVEQEESLFIYGTIGTPTNTAIHRYLNAKKVPQLLLSSGAAKWNDPKNFPWSISVLPSYVTEGRIYAEHILKTKPNAKIAVLYQNDDFGKDYYNGVKQGLGDKAKMIVADASYETTDPTVDSQMVALKASGADVFINLSSPKFAASAIRKAGEIGWTPTQYVVQVSSSVGAVLKPAGFDKATGVMTVMYLKEPLDKQWADDPGVKRYLAYMKKYYPDGDLSDGMNVLAANSAQILVQIIKQCGDDLTRENVMRQAANLKNLQTDMLLPGISVNTSPTDFEPIKQLQLARFDGTQWVRVGGVMGAAGAK